MNNVRAERGRLARIAEFEAEERKQEELEAKEAEKRRRNATQKHKDRVERRKRRQQVRRMKGKVMDKIRQQATVRRTAWQMKSVAAADICCL